MPVTPGYASAAGPSRARSTARLPRYDTAASRSPRPHRAGHFAAPRPPRPAADLAAPLGAHPAMAELALHRFDEAVPRAPRRRPRARPLAGAPGGDDLAVRTVTVVRRMDGTNYT